MTLFKRAVRKASKLRIGLVGPAGSGKTMTALRLAMGLAPGGRIAVIDTEHDSASLYQGECVEEGQIDFCVVSLDDYQPGRFIEAIRAAEAEGFDVLIIDSLSHAWSGVLAEKDRVTRTGAPGIKRGDSFAAWRVATPMHNELVTCILASGMHVIATMRCKTEYTMEVGSDGKSRPAKVGLAPIQRNGMEYEFTVVADLDNGVSTVTKTRCSPLQGQAYEHAGADVAGILRDWLDGGEAAPDFLTRVLSESGIPQEEFDRWAAASKRDTIQSMSDGQLYAAARWLEGRGAGVVTGWLADHPSPSLVEAS
jgi:hypothetical protein